MFIRDLLYRDQNPFGGRTIYDTVFDETCCNDEKTIFLYILLYTSLHGKILECLRAKK